MRVRIDDGYGDGSGLGGDGGIHRIHHLGHIGVGRTGPLVVAVEQRPWSWMPYCVGTKNGFVVTWLTNTNL
jgi:hypothetical protein